MVTIVKDLKNLYLDPEQNAKARYFTMQPALSKPSDRKFQRVLLISPPATLFAGDLPRCTYPLGPGYIAAVLEANSYEVKILDCLLEGYDRQESLEGDDRFIKYGLTTDEIAEHIKNFKPDLVGISSIFSNQADAVSDIFRLVKKICPEVKMATGGAHARYFPFNYIEDLDVDAVFLGESELTFLQYMEHLNGFGTIEDISSVVIKKDGQIYSNDSMALIRKKKRNEQGFWAEIDDIPFPAWHLFNMEKYFSIGAYQSPYTIGDRVGQIYTSRGCTAKCTFCTTTNFWGGKLRRRSPENVIDEIVFLKEHYSINEFHIQDDNITNDKTHAKHLFRHLRDISMPWCTPQGMALWRMDEELLELMAESGCYQITLAIESGVQRVLNDLIRKPLDLGKTKHLIKYARKLGLSVHGFFIIGMPPMFGNPGETIDEMRKTFEFAQEACFSSASFFIATPVVGSVLLNECIRQKLIPSDTPLYKMSYKQGLISAPGLWETTEIASLAREFNVTFNQSKEMRESQREWDAGQY